MKIKKIISQHRRDFRALYVCDHEDCNHSHVGSGYDDAHFHQNVIPNKKCPECGRKALEDYRALTTKYPPHQIV